MLPGSPIGLATTNRVAPAQHLLIAQTPPADPSVSQSTEPPPAAILPDIAGASAARVHHTATLLLASHPGWFTLMPIVINVPFVSIAKFSMTAAIPGTPTLTQMLTRTRS